jgi:hypothetical protein
MNITYTGTTEGCRVAHVDLCGRRKIIVHQVNIVSAKKLAAAAANSTPNAKYQYDMIEG